MSGHRPKHIGIIPDGNRRWAQAHGMEKQDGYEYGLIPGLKLLQEAKRQGIEEVTYYGYTTDNCKRPVLQQRAFQRACIEAVKLLEQEGAQLRILGKMDSKCFPEELKAYTDCRMGMADTYGLAEKKKELIKVNFLVNYGWKWDLSRIQMDGIPHSKDIPRMDLIIRWGGMRRLSGFLPVQSVYADFYVIERLWPDYRDEDFRQALSWYEKQDVTLGG